MEILGVTFDNVLVWSLSLLTAAIGMYWYLTKTYDYWKKMGIPYVPAIPIMGSMGQMLSKPLHEIDLQTYREKGVFYGTYEGRRPVLLIGEPDLLKDILVKDFQFFPSRRTVVSGSQIGDKLLPNMQGEDWKRVRMIITPAFTTGKIKRTVGIFIDSAKTLVGNFRQATEEGKSLEMKTMFGAFAMDVIGSSAFATKIDSFNDPENPFVSTTRKAFKTKFPWRFLMFFLMPKAMKFFGISIFPSGVIEFYENVTLKIIEERKKNGIRRNDFLQLMIEAAKEQLGKDDETDEKDATAEIGHEEVNDKLFKITYTTKTLSNDELVAQCVVFFLAGFDTISTTLAFTSYELALNGDIQDRLIAEIDATIREKGGLTYDAIVEMKYLDKVITETLRKYPPAARFDRIAAEDYYIKEYGITLPKGMLVSVPVYALHHDPKHYPDPEKYDPERFSPEQKSTRHPFAYVPFGAGPRNCVGMRFALMEMKVCLAYVLSQCRFKKCSETDVPLKFSVGVGMLQSKNVLLKVEMRNDAVEI